MTGNPVGPTELTQLLTAARMKRLYWIDDEFGSSDLRTAQLLRTKILTLWDLSAQEKLNHPLLETIVPGSDPKFIEDTLTKVIADGRANDVSRELIESVDRQIAEHDKEHEVGVKDLSPTQFNEIASAFQKAGATVEKLSLKQWLENIDAIQAEVEPEVVFFIDHDFSREEGGAEDTGEQILKTVLAFAKQSFTCVLFTHGTTRESQQAKRTEIADRLGLGNATHRFSVVSKENLTAPGTGSDYGALRDAFKDVFVRDWCNTIAQECIVIFADSFAETKAALLGLNFQDIAAAFFRMPINDGTLEFDVLLRVLLLGARIKLEDLRPQNPLIWSQLARVRNVLAESQADTVEQASPEALKHLRDREVFDPGEVINQMFCPPALGDVFVAKNKGKESYFVLIGQPCDMAVRSNGFRKATEAVFLRVTAKEPKRENFYYKFELPGVGQRWIAYEEPIPVNLHLLDLVSFRADGCLVFHSNMKPTDFMLPGVKKRFESFKTPFDAIKFDEEGKPKSQLPNKYLRLTINGVIPGTETVIAEGEIKMDVHRIGRIRSPYADALMGGFALHQTRKAFDFDFSNLSEFIEEPDADATPPA